MLICADFFYETIYDSRYDKIWKARDYFPNITITVLFLQNTVIYLHRTHSRIYVLISPKSNGKIVIRNYHDNILAFKKDNYEILLDFYFYILFFIYYL